VWLYILFRTVYEYTSTECITKNDQHPYMDENFRNIRICYFVIRVKLTE